MLHAKRGRVAFLLIATLLSAALIAFGLVALLFPRPEARLVSDYADADRGAPAAHAGEGAVADATPATPMARLKAVLRTGDWRRALPSLLVIAGVLGVMIFGSLAMLFVFGHAAAGIGALAVTLFAIARLVIDYARA
jgi:hypothetical protein